MPINRLFRIFKLGQELLVLLICILMKSINTCSYNCLWWLSFKISCFCFTSYSWLSAAYLTSKNNFSWIAFMRVNFFLTESNILWTRKDAFDDVLGNFPLIVLCSTAMVYQSEKSYTYIKSVIFIDPSWGSYTKNFLINVIQPFIESKPICIFIFLDFIN